MKEIKEINIEAPNGFEIDEENSTFKKIVFKKIEPKKPPMSWDEYAKLNGKKALYYYDKYSADPIEPYYPETASPLGMPSEEEAIALWAWCKLIHLRDAWIGDWRPDWKDSSFKEVIFKDGQEIVQAFRLHESHVLAFPTAEMRDKFYKAFKNLIEEAKIFL